MNATAKMDDLFIPNLRPFEPDTHSKDEYLKARLSELMDYHESRCEPYAALLEDWRRTSGGKLDSLADFPYVPVTLFKEYALKSSTDNLTVIQSSSTTSANASKVYVDKESRKRQARSANLILGDFVGTERRPYIVFDLEETVRGAGGFSARGAAIMALAHMASEFLFVMKDGERGPELDYDALRAAAEKIGDQPFISYGFTYLLYQAHQALSEFPPFKAHPDSVFLHSGGWKRLTEIAVDKPTFNKRVADCWSLRPENVIDFYGMVEQIGVVYPDCPEGVKHVPYWADIIMRRADTLEPVEVGEVGLIQLISCLPLSAPNHSVLSEDLGRIVGVDNCPCGRRGIAFTFEGRAPRSETRGCSDVVRR
ncbi:MAG: acyl-protein synthetase [Pseudomonadota bacterium]